jgi:hypothetical protein
MATLYVKVYSILNANIVVIIERHSNKEEIKSWKCLSV